MTVIVMAAATGYAFWPGASDRAPTTG